jgi:hypothetical protein
MNELLRHVIIEWSKAEPKYPFFNLLHECCFSGAVIIKDGVVLIAKPARWDGKKAHFNYTGVNNCWFIFAAASKIGMLEFLELAPYELEHVCYQRRGKMKHTTWEYLKRRLKY